MNRKRYGLLLTVVILLLTAPLPQNTERKNGFTCISPTVELADKTVKRTGKPVKPEKGKAVGTTGAVTWIDKAAELIVPQKQLKAYVKLFKESTGFRNTMTIRK